MWTIVYPCYCIVFQGLDSPHRSPAHLLSFAVMMEHAWLSVRDVTPALTAQTDQMNLTAQVSDIW